MWNVRIPNMATTEETRLRKKLAQLAERQHEVLEELGALVSDPEAKSGDIQRVQREQARLAAMQERLLTDFELARLDERTHPHWQMSVINHSLPSTLTGKRPMREQALDILEEIGVPSAPRTVSEIAACFGLSLPASRFSSLRRDEQRAFKKDPFSRPAWVVPAINVVGLTAIPRLICSSSWEDERRVIGSRTLHVNHLKTLLTLLAAAERVPRLGEANAERVYTLVTRYATSVPGAIKFGEELDYGRIEAAVRSELERVEPSDEKERRDAAEKMAKTSDFYRLWGRPAVIEGAAERGAS
jgi:hypothetical protein